MPSGDFVGNANSAAPYRNQLSLNEVEHLLNKVAFGGGLNRTSSAVLGDIPTSAVYSSPALDVLPATTDIRSVVGEILSGAGLSASAAFPGFTSPSQLGITANSSSS